MASVGFLALLDDIASLLDDVAAISKVAAHKTAGVLGDDLALNAQQVSGVKADRELAVVFAVAKGSFINKLILVPMALLISAVAPWLVTPLLMLGGLYLCFEGVEKLAEKWLHDKQDKAHHHKALVDAVNSDSIDIKAFESGKIKGAIRTDFILSAEIIIIALGVAQNEAFLTRAISVSLIAIVVTALVYGLVAAIVKFDDLGLALIKSTANGVWKQIQQMFGRFILLMAPKLMRLLSVVGMLAMFLVGGGILVHGLPFIHHMIEPLINNSGNVTAALLPVLFNGLFGVIAGVVALSLVTLLTRLLGK